jgi:hypothetical protein
MWATACHRPLHCTGPGRKARVDILVVEVLWGSGENGGGGLTFGGNVVRGKL